MIHQTFQSQYLRLITNPRYVSNKNQYIDPPLQRLSEFIQTVQEKLNGLMNELIGSGVAQ